MTDDLRRRIERAAAALIEAGAKEVYLFGSAASERFNEQSDVDLAVAGLPTGVFFAAMAAAHDALDRPLDLVDLDDRNPFTDYLRSKGNLVRVA